MRVVYLGGGDDGRGLALAGVAKIDVIDADALVRTLSSLASEDSPPGLLLVSAEVAALSPAALAAFERRSRRSAVLVLPSATADPGGRDAHPR